MKVFLTGGTGAIGRPAVALLVAAGHEVTAVARTPEKRSAVEAGGATGVTVDLFDAVLPSSPPPWPPGAARSVQESIVFPYPDTGDAWIDGLTTETDPSPFMASSADAETRAAGDPDGYTSSIHVDDAAAAVVAALGAPPGVYDVVDDEPLRRRDFAAALAATAGHRRHVRMPGRAIRVGGAQTQALVRSQRVSNRRFKEATGWQPRWPSAAAGLAALAESPG